MIWIDAQISPSIAGWISETLECPAVALRDIGLRDAADLEIFRAAREADAIVITKDKDFVDLLDRYGPPPRVLWLTCGNTSNERLREIFAEHLVTALRILESEHLVELG